MQFLSIVISFVRNISLCTYILTTFQYQMRWYGCIFKFLSTKVREKGPCVTLIWCTKQKCNTSAENDTPAHWGNGLDICSNICSNLFQIITLATLRSHFLYYFIWIECIEVSLFQMRTTASVTKSLHQDHGGCYTLFSSVAK